MANLAPTSVNLNGGAVAEGVANGTVVGILSAADVNIGSGDVVQI